MEGKCDLSMSMQYILQFGEGLHEAQSNVLHLQPPDQPIIDADPPLLCRTRTFGDRTSVHAFTEPAANHVSSIVPK